MQSFSRRSLNRLLFSLSMFATMAGILAYHQPAGLSLQTLKDMTSQILAEREELVTQTTTDAEYYGNPGEYEVSTANDSSSMTAEEFRLANQNNADLNTEEMGDYLNYFSKMEDAIDRAASLMAAKVRQPAQENALSEKEKTLSSADQKNSTEPSHSKSLVIELDKSEAGKKRK